MMADRRIITIGFTAAVSLHFVLAHANEPHDHKRHTQDAHVHGVWELFAALDSKQLSVTVKGPIIDVLGFEHPPANESERAALQNLASRLDEPDVLFSLSNRAGCTLSEPAKIILPEAFSKDIAKEHSDAHEHGDHHHNESAAEDHHDNHDSHTSDLEISYIFDCASPSRLTEISVTGFASFTAIASIDAVFLGDTIQAAARLEGAAKTLKIE